MPPKILKHLHWFYWIIQARNLISSTLSIRSLMIQATCLALLILDIKSNGEFLGLSIVAHTFQHPFIYKLHCFLTSVFYPVSALSFHDSLTWKSVSIFLLYLRINPFGLHSETRNTKTAMRTHLKCVIQNDIHNDNWGLI